MIEDRLADIEIALARQDDLLDTLNTTVWKQQRRIDELEALCTGLAQRLAEAQQRISDAGSGEAVQEIPPHY